MKALITLTIAVALLTGISACGKDTNPPAEANDSSYEFRFLSGPLQGREFKASGLTRSQITSLFTEQASENIKGIITQISTSQMTVAATVGLTGNNQVQPFNSDNPSIGTQLFLTFTEGNTSYAYGAQSGTPTIKNLKIATVGSGGGGSLGLTTYELAFENATFYDEIAAGNGENVVVRVSGKIVIK